MIRPDAAEPIPLLVDTDIGGDIDDANALAFLAASPRVELVGVTTVGAGGSARRRAEVAASLFAAAGRTDIEVSAGIDEPLRANPILRRLPAEHILNAHEPSMRSAQVSGIGAVERIIQAATTHAGELVLLTIGCLTNVATAVSEAPDALQRIGRLVVMGGAFDDRAREANVAIDPEAADIIVRSGLPVQFVGLEVARRVRLPLTVYDQSPFRDSRLGAFFARIAACYGVAYGVETMTLYDVVAAAAVTDPELFRTVDRRVAVELDGRYTRGLTVVDGEGPFDTVPGGSRVSVSEWVDAVAVERLFRERVLAGHWA